MALSGLNSCSNSVCFLSACFITDYDRDVMYRQDMILYDVMRCDTLDLLFFVPAVEMMFSVAAKYRLLFAAIPCGNVMQYHAISASVLPEFPPLDL